MGASDQGHIPRPCTICLSSPLALLSAQFNGQPPHLGLFFRYLVVFKTGDFAARTGIVMPRYPARLRFLIGIGLILIGAWTAAWFAPSATANPQDADFLHRLDEIGITYTNPYATISYAQGVCRELNLGVPHPRVVDLVRYDNPAFDWDGAADYVVVAYMTYCPWNR